MPDDIGQGEERTISAREEGESGSRVIKLHVPALGGDSTGEDSTLGRPGFNNHSASISSIAPQSPSDTPIVSAAWIESPMGDTSGLGRIMWQRFNTGAAANDNAIWATRHDGIGAIGREPLLAELASGEALLTWIDADGHAHCKLYPPDDEAHGGRDAAAYAAVNASLAELGSTAPAPDGNRRLQVIEQRPGNLAVMWLALAESGYVLRGTTFSTPHDASPNGDGSTATPIADVRLPSGFTGQFALQLSPNGSGEVNVSYTVGAQGSVVVALRKAADVHAVSDFTPVDADAPVGGGHASHSSSGSRNAPADAAEKAVVVDASHALDGAAPLPLLIKLGEGAISEPIVTALRDGFAVAWEEPGATEKAVAIKVALFDEQGTVRTLADGGTAITVTDNALQTVAPSITEVGSGGVGVAYVNAATGGLVLEAFGNSGDQIGSEIVVDSGKDGAISDIAMTSNQGPNEGSNSGNEDVAIVYVRDDHDDDDAYGSIMVQRYRAQDEDDDGTPEQLSAVGADGQADGNDEPTQLTTSQPAADGGEATSQDIHGRAPAVAGLEDGDLAIVWVENEGEGETIKGAVLEADGTQVLHIDLTALLRHGGVVRGTEPILIANADGDILVSWMQRGDDDYVVMAAVYDSSGPGKWTAPAAPMELQSFDKLPKDFHVTWAGDEGNAIDLTWRKDSSGSGSDGTYTQQFDLDGNDLGNAKKVSGGDMPDDGSTAAGVIDGQIIVVYTEENRNGDLDLSAQVIDAKTGDTDTVGIAQGINSSALAIAPDRTISSVNNLSTHVDQELAVNVLGTTAGATVSHINGEPITTAEPVDVGSGWVQLREDGSLTISPDDGYTGQIAFDYTVNDAANGSVLTNRIAVNVADEQGAETGIKLADLDLSSGDFNVEGLTAAGLDADMFQIVGSTLYLKAGLEFDFDTKPSLTVEVRASGAAEADAGVNFTLNVAPEHADGGAEAVASADSFVFAPGFGDGSNTGNDAHEVIDMSSSPYTTFQELLDSGALVQSGHDVVITMDPTDPGHSDKITLRGIELSALTSADFKF